MRAAQVTRLDGPESVEVVDVPDPEEGGGSGRRVVLDVAAAGICFPDVLLTRGQYQMKPDPPFVPGSEVAGVVRSAPAGSGFAPGDRVAAFPVLGGFAEAVAVDPAMVFPLPDATTWSQGAALPMNYLTCEFALRERGPPGGRRGRPRPRCGRRRRHRGRPAREGRRRPRHRGRLDGRQGRRGPCRGGRRGRPGRGLPRGRRRAHLGARGRRRRRPGRWGPAHRLAPVTGTRRAAPRHRLHGGRHPAR